MKSIEFAPEHVEPIHAGAKTATVRIDECEEIERGDRVRLVTDDGEHFETARIVSTVETFVGGAFHAIRSLDACYPSESTQELVDGLRHHYGQAVGPRSPCRVLCWELVEADQPLVADGGTVAAEISESSIEEYLDEAMSGFQAETRHARKLALTAYLDWAAEGSA